MSPVAGYGTHATARWAAEPDKDPPAEHRRGPFVRDRARVLPHLLSLPPALSSTTARPASSRATGTRNGEQDT